jgi:hypothetical protein
MRRIQHVKSLALLAALALGVTLASGGQARAQWGGGYGFGAGYGYGGWGGGYGAFGNMGMSLYDQAAVKEQYFMMGAARYNLDNAAAEQAYQSANLMQQQAINTALENQRLSYQLAKDKYDVSTRVAASVQEARAAAPKVPIDSLINSEGQVLWPDYAPSGGAHGERRARLDAAIRIAYDQTRKNGHAGVGEVVEARRLLQAYGNPALKLLAARSDKRARAGMVEFLNALDAALDGMGSDAAEG